MYVSTIPYGGAPWSTVVSPSLSMMTRPAWSLSITVARTLRISAWLYVGSALCALMLRTASSWPSGAESSIALTSTVFGPSSPGAKVRTPAKSQVRPLSIETSTVRAPSAAASDGDAAADTLM